LKTRLTQITNPSPAMAFAFLDVSEREICDGAFFLMPMGAAGGDQMYNDIPSDRHAQGGNFSFVDGHVEHHPWRWPKPYVSSHVLVANNDDLQDMRWLQERLPGP
ncbi:MAG: H-X9-DG-CTERM domain-containing protein, partial [Bryobacteraceae bacterium]